MTFDFSRESGDEDWRRGFEQKWSCSCKINFKFQEKKCLIVIHWYDAYFQEKKLPTFFFQNLRWRNFCLFEPKHAEFGEKMTQLKNFGSSIPQMKLEGQNNFQFHHNYKRRRHKKSKSYFFEVWSWPTFFFQKFWS